MWRQLAYQSVLKSEIDETVVAEILQYANRRNPTLDITGMLVYHQRRFVQLLEGPATNVRALYTRIEQDARHHSVRLCAERMSDERSVPKFAMAFFTPDTALRELVGLGFVLTAAQVKAVVERLPPVIAACFVPFLAEMGCLKLPPRHGSSAS